MRLSHWPGTRSRSRLPCGDIFSRTLKLSDGGFCLLGRGNDHSLYRNEAEQLRRGCLLTAMSTAPLLEDELTTEGASAYLRLTQFSMMQCLHVFRSSCCRSTQRAVRIYSRGGTCSAAFEATWLAQGITDMVCHEFLVETWQTLTSRACPI